MAFLCHLRGGYLEHHGFSVSLAHSLGGFRVGTEVYMLPAHGFQAFFQDDRYRFCCSTMPEDFRWVEGFELKVDVYGMSLTCPDAPSIFGKGKAFFIVVFNDVSKRFEIERPAVGFGFFE